MIPGPDAEPQGAATLLAAGEAHLLAGRLAEARAALSAAATAAMAAKDPTMAARAEWTAGKAAHFAGDVAAARAHLVRAIADPEEAGEEIASRAGALLGFLEATTDPRLPVDGLARLREAVACAERVRAAHPALEALTYMGRAAHACGRLPEALEAFTRAGEIAGDLGQAGDLLSLQLAEVCLDAGDLAQAVDLSTKAREALTAQGQHLAVPMAAVAEGLARVLAGDMATGIAALEWATNRALETGNRFVELSILPRLVEGWLALGQVHRAAATASRAAELALELETPAPAALAWLTPACAGLAGDAAAVAALTAAAEAARAQGAAVHEAKAWRWLAEVAPAHPNAGAARAAAAALAAAGGMNLLAAEVAWLEALAGSPDPGPIRAGLDRARRCGAVPLATLCESAVWRGDEAARRLQALTVGLDDEAREAYLGLGERRRALANPQVSAG